jgi:hypothetical protein
VDENGRALSMKAFANIKGIPHSTFCKYANGKLGAGGYVGRQRKITISKTANLKATKTQCTENALE